MTERHLVWVLVGSLLVNAFLLGFMGNHVLHILPPRNMGFSMFRPPELSEDARKILDRTIEPERPAIEHAMQAMDSSKHQVESLLKEETVNTSAIDSALAEMRAANTVAFDGLEKTLRAAAQMNVTERRTLVDVLSRLPAPGPLGPRGFSAGPRGFPSPP